jgi:hypothetical protein
MSINRLRARPSSWQEIPTKAEQRVKVRDSDEVVIATGASAKGEGKGAAQGKGKYKRTREEASQQPQQHALGGFSEVKVRVVALGNALGQDQDPQQCRPRLALVSYALACKATPTAKDRRDGDLLADGPRQQLSSATTRLLAAAHAADGRCDWLCGYCDFLRKRHWLMGPPGGGT